MSMQVPVETLAEVVHGYGPSAYAVVSAPDGAPRVTHVTPTFVGVTLTFGLGRTSIALLEANPRLSLLWPAAQDEVMSLIVDADVLDMVEDGTVTARAVSAVRHRRAPDPESHDSTGSSSGD
ncbi:MAG: hypothetical protein AAF081_00400 [Actinomycetota bacterium]